MKSYHFVADGLNDSLKINCTVYLGLAISHLPFGPTAYFTLSNCVLRHDIPECTPASQGRFAIYRSRVIARLISIVLIGTAYPHLILDNLNTKIGKRIFKILQALYPVPKSETRRIITFKNDNDFISFRHHTYSKEKGQVALKENGPRFEMQPYEVSIYIYFFCICIFEK